MSTEIFPRRLPLDKPPPRDRSIVKERRTLYGLAWVCSRYQLSKNLVGVSTVHGEHRDAISEQWKGPFSFELAPTAVLAMDGNYYLVALWNRPHPGHTLEAIIEAARTVFGVDEKAIPEWHRFPLAWVIRDKQEREKRALDESVEDLAIANEPPLSAPGTRAH